MNILLILLHWFGQTCEYFVSHSVFLSFHDIPATMGLLDPTAPLDCKKVLEKGNIIIYEAQVSGLFKTTLLLTLHICLINHNNVMF